eukprot:1737511-Pleurochrysis_carterae.AAC.1
MLTARPILHGKLQTDTKANTINARMPYLEHGRGQSGSVPSREHGACSRSCLRPWVKRRATAASATITVRDDDARYLRWAEASGRVGYAI